MKALRPAQLQRLSITQVGNMTPKMVQNLSPQQLKVSSVLDPTMPDCLLVLQTLLSAATLLPCLTEAHVGAVQLTAFLPSPPSLPTLPQPCQCLLVAPLFSFLFPPSLSFTRTPAPMRLFFLPLMSLCLPSRCPPPAGSTSP